jgi:hypothetical protein
MSGLYRIDLCRVHVSSHFDAMINAEVSDSGRESKVDDETEIVGMISTDLSRVPGGRDHRIVVENG